MRHCSNPQPRLTSDRKKISFSLEVTGLASHGKERISYKDIVDSNFKDFFLSFT